MDRRNPWFGSKRSPNQLTPPHVPELDYTLDLPQVQQLLQGLSPRSPLRRFIENDIIQEFGVDYSPEALFAEFLPEDADCNLFSFNGTLQEFKAMGDVRDFADEETRDWHIDWMIRLWQVIYHLTPPIEKLNPLYHQLQILLEVLIHSPWNETDEIENIPFFPYYTFKEAWLVWRLITGMWSHVNHEHIPVEEPDDYDDDDDY